jgi:hypothetical protein
LVNDDLDRRIFMHLGLNLKDQPLTASELARPVPAAAGGAAISPVPERPAGKAFSVERAEDGRIRYKISDELFKAAARAAGRVLAQS